MSAGLFIFFKSSHSEIRDLIQHFHIGIIQQPPVLLHKPLYQFLIPPDGCGIIIENVYRPVFKVLLHHRNVIADHLFRLSFYAYHQTDGIKKSGSLLRLTKIRMFIQDSFPKVIIKGFHTHFVGNRYSKEIPHLLQTVPIDPVAFKDQPGDVFCADHCADIFQCFPGKLKTASGIDDLQHAKSSCHLIQYLPVLLYHFFFLPSVIVDIITEGTFSPGTGKRPQQHDFPGIFFRNHTVSFHVSLTPCHSLPQLAQNSRQQQTHRKNRNAAIRIICQKLHHENAAGQTKRRPGQKLYQYRGSGRGDAAK